MAAKHLDWRASLALYGDRRIATVLVLGFSSGLPLALTGSTLSAWLATDGLTRTAIGLFALAGLPYSLKFLWAPAIDGLRLPVLTALLGRRRGWAIVCQVALLAAIAALGSVRPAEAPALTAALAVLVAFLSASQDIVIDAYRVESLAEHEQGAGAATIQIGYRLGMLASGAGALYLADSHGFLAAYLVMAGLVAVGIAAILASPEPAAPAAAPPQGAAIPLADWIARHVVAPFADFMSRPGWLAILAFILLYKFGDAVAGIMSNPFYISIGFSLSEIASVTKVFGLAATVAGALLGGLAVARWGIARALLVCGVLQAVTILLFVVQAKAGHDLGFLALTVAGENLTGGMGTAAFVAYLSSLCRTSFTATQYALLSSFAAVGRTTLAASGGWIADRVDWIGFFFVATAAALPGLVLLLWMIDRFPAKEGLTPEGR
jgi:PAT family beta-lactamase induction signal transducer AmpG